MLDRLGRWCYRRRRRVVILWIIALFGLGFIGSKWKADTSDNFDLPSSESQQVFNLLSAKFGGFADDGARIVMQADRGFNDPAVHREVGTLLTSVQASPVVAGVGSPYAIGAGGGISADGKIAFASIRLNVRGPDVPRE